MWLTNVMKTISSFAMEKKTWIISNYSSRNLQLIKNQHFYEKNVTLRWGKLYCKVFNVHPNLCIQCNSKILLFVFVEFNIFFWTK